MSTLQQIVRNTVTGWGAVFFRTAIALVMVPFLLHHLGREGYGFAGLLMALIGMIEIADLGLRQALGRELSEQVARRDQAAFNELLSTSCLLYVSVALAFVAGMWLAAPWLIRVMQVPDSIAMDAVLALRLYASPAILMSFMAPLFSAALTSINRFDLVNSIQIAAGLLGSLALFVVIPRSGNPIGGWMVVMLAQQALALVLLASSFRRQCVGAALAPRHVRPARLRPLFHLGGYMYALQLSQNLSERSDPFVVSYFFGPAGIALYHPGGRMSQMLRPVVLTMADQLYPMATQEHVRNQTDRLRAILVLGTRYTFLLGILVVVGLFVFADPFCRLWLSASLGEDYRIAAYVMMGWAAVDFLVFAAGSQWSVLLGMRRLKFLVWTQLPSAALNVIISIYLVGFTSLGIPGVLVATILIGLIRRPLLIWYTARCAGLRMRDYLRLSYLRPAWCFIITLSAAFAARFMIPIHGYSHLGAAAALVAAAWMTAAWFIGLEPNERATLGAALRNRLERRSAP
ncbi:MAG TPA: oligosaccharide flippase family protein [Kiritimatiellia bacterium]|nr:oligosaccharide flippase family protein [Kiritimatiellia bacterium]